MSRTQFAALTLAVSIGLGLIVPLSGWAFAPAGRINADFSYRNLYLHSHGGRHYLSGLLKNRSDRAHLGVLILFQATDCVTGRSKWQAPFYIDNIDPQVEIPFKINLASPPGYVCKFSFRTGYHLLPAAHGSAGRKDGAHLQTQAPQPANPDRVVYAWIDRDGMLRYSRQPVERRDWEELGTAHPLQSAPIYTWIDPQGATRYSDSPPEPQVSVARHQLAMQTADNIEAYAAAMRQHIWANWLHPPDVSARGGPFEARVRFSVLRDGRIRHIRIANSSGIDALDESFYNAVAKSDPLPPLPAQFVGLSYNAQIAFTRQDRR